MTEGLDWLSVFLPKELISILSMEKYWNWNSVYICINVISSLFCENNEYLRLFPPSPSSDISCFVWFIAKSFKWAHSSAFHISVSVNCPNGSRFTLNVSENNTGSFKVINVWSYHLCYCFWIKKINNCFLLWLHFWKISWKMKAAF